MNEIKKLKEINLEFTNKFYSFESMTDEYKNLIQTKNDLQHKFSVISKENESLKRLSEHRDNDNVTEYINQINHLKHELREKDNIIEKISQMEII